LFVPCSPPSSFPLLRFQADPVLPSCSPILLKKKNKR
jgi:hypothetical protein